MKNAFLAGRRRQAAARQERARQHGPRGRRRQGRRHAHARRSRPPRRRHARLRRLPRRLRGDHPQGQEQQARRRRLPGRQRDAHQPGHDRHRPVGAAADARPGRDRRRRQHRLPGRVRGRRPPQPVVARHLQGRHDHQHLRPPHHPGRRVGAVPEARPRAAARRARLLRRHLPRPRHAVRGRQVAARRQPDRPRRGDAAQADAGRQADPRPSRARPPDRRPRSAALEEAAHAGRARPGDVRPHDLGPRPRVPHRRRGRPRPRCGSATCSACCATRTAARSASSTCTSRRPTSRTGSRARSKAPTRRCRSSRRTASSSASTPPRRSRSSSPPSTSAPSGSASKAPSRRSRSSTRSSPARPTPGSTGRASAWPTAAGSTCLSNIMGKSYEAIFSEFEGHVDPTTVQGSGDVKYHLGATGKYVSPSGADIQLELAANPSHLETVNPIVMGIVRATQDQIDPPGSYPVLPLLIHGDAAFAGQGIVAECLAMSDIAGYRVGGTIHLIINNQIGFTTAPAVRPLVDLLLRRRQDGPGADLPRQRRRPRGVRPRRQAGVGVPPDVPQGRRDRHGLLPALRPQRGRRPELHAAADVQGDRRAPQRAQAVRRDAREARRHHRRRGRAGAVRLPGQAPGGARRDPRPRDRAGQGAQAAQAARRAAAHRDRCRPRRARPRSSPSSPTTRRASPPHPKLAKQFEGRHPDVRDEGEVDWATAESLAIGSLVLEGHPVRLAGQDSRRGTFSQRHAALVDYETGEPWIPLDELEGAEASFWVYDSLLSEYAGTRVRVRLRARQHATRW